MLRGKKILVGVSGSIAAYQSAHLTRLLIKEGAEVRVVMTAAATRFITPLTLATLSRNPVLNYFVDGDSSEWNSPAELALWSDLIVVAPASAHTLAKCAHGLCDNLLSAVYLSAQCPVFFVPAMDPSMYQHPATRQNLEKLLSYGNQIIPEESANEYSEEGRMVEPERIVDTLRLHFGQQTYLKGKTVLLTAGPTVEDIDPVRYISNHSTGKMGYALARQLAQWGATVKLISGPTHLPVPAHPAIETIKVRSAQDMYMQCLHHFPEADIAILAAAVADYTPKVKAPQKIKKKAEEFGLELTKTVDIAATLGRLKQPGQLLVGFALETHDELQHARAKLAAKNLDLIILNSMNDPGAAFGHDTNKITALDVNGSVLSFPLKSKTEVATDISGLILTKLKSGPHCQNPPEELLPVPQAVLQE